MMAILGHGMSMGDKGCKNDLSRHRDACLVGRVPEQPRLVGFARNWITRPETGSEPEFRFWLTGNGMAFKNYGSG